MAEDQPQEVTQNVSSNAEVMSVGDYLITFLLGSITCGIMYIVWAFSSGTNPNKANFCKATLIMYLIMIAMYFVAGVALLGTIGAIMGGGSY